METPEEEKKSEVPFKKPMLVGKIGKLPKKLQNLPSTVNKPEDENVEEFKHPAEVEPPSVQNPQENSKNVPYEEPGWSGVPQSPQDYALEVLKSGSIVETINLTKKPFWVFGRLPNCDICMQHPTISRYHAVLQYRSSKNEYDSSGYYIYDLESTHGTFLNKTRIKPRTYVKVHVGHMLKLGCSTRTYILSGPEEDREEESEFTVTELKQKRLDQLQERELRKQREEEIRKKQEERGIDWGMGEDADEESDLSENPYAETNNEDLYLENPKKALRGFFEREGLDLEYDCSEQGIGQFMCKVELPIDDEMGRPIFAEVVHKGKKKEAVIQCALEACSILDRHGLLRQATHESRKRKPKNWEENDYYDSDDDTFLDRTGTIEKKREKRMNAKQPQKAETYENLLEKEKNISKQIRDLEVELSEAQRRLGSEDKASKSEEDSLDSFMMELKQSKPSKQTVSRLKSELMRLKQEHLNVIKLVNIAKPASLPPLVADYETNQVSAGSSERKSLPMFGKRKKIKMQLPEKPAELYKVPSDDEEEEEIEEEKKFLQDDGVKNEELEEKDTPMEVVGKIKENEPKEVKGKNIETIKKQISEQIEKKKRKNQKKLQREETQLKKDYSDNLNSEDYSMWVPPNDQTGDGRTSLNEKYGY